MSDVPSAPGSMPADTTAGGAYMQEAAIQDQFLRDRLCVIKRQYESGACTEAEAANLRVAAISHHLLVATDLSNEYFPPSVS